MHKQLFIVALLVLVGCQQQPKPLTEAQMKEKAFKNAASLLVDSFRRKFTVQQKHLDITTLNDDVAELRAQWSDLPEARHDFGLAATRDRLLTAIKEFESIAVFNTLAEQFAQMNEIADAQKMKDEAKGCISHLSSELNGIESDLK